MLLTLLALPSLAMAIALPQGADEASAGSAPITQDAPVWRMTLDTAITASGQRTFLQDVFLSAGDVDRDGRDDVLIGSEFAGTITVRSGRDGHTILDLSGNPAMGFGQSVGAAGDVNGDGYDDVIHGESGYVFDDGQLGRAVVTSGRSGKTLLEIPGRLAGDLTGYSVSGVGDLDGDGRDDIGIGSPGVSRVSVHSGKDGSVLLDIEEFSPPNAIGQYVRGAGDVDGDGVPDVLIGILDISTNDLDRSARVYSGADGSILFTVDGGPSAGQIDLAMDAAGDVDADGFDDIVILSRVGIATSALAYGGPDGHLIAQFPGPGFPQAAIVDVAGAGDVDGDGHDDILVGTLEIVTGGFRVYSGATGGLLRSDKYAGDPHIALEVSVNGGSDVNGDGFDDLFVSIHQAEWAVPITPSRGRVIFGGDPWFIQLGDRVRDRLAPFNFDEARFEAVAGTRLDVAMRSIDKQGFVPGLSLAGSSTGIPITLPAEASGKGNLARVRKLVLPETGSYTLKLGFGGPFPEGSGAYTVRTRARPPRGKGVVEASAPGDDAVPFVPGHRVHGVVTSAVPTMVAVDLAAGSKLSLRARATGGTGLRPALRVLDPDGALLSDAMAAGHARRIVRLPIPQTGTYIVEVLGDGGTSGGFLLRTKARTPRGKARIDAPALVEFP